MACRRALMPTAPAPATSALATLRPKRLATLVLCVLLAHVLVIELLARLSQGSGVLELMTDPDFSHTLKLEQGVTDVQPASASTVDMLAQSTVGQVVQARTLLLLAPSAPRETLTSAALKPAQAPPRKAKRSTSPSNERPAPQVATDTSAESSPPPVPTGDIGVPSIPAQAAFAPPATDAMADLEEHAPVQIKKNEQNSDLTLYQIESSAIDVEVNKAAWLATWPVSTRLSYKMTGYFRGDFSGKARVQWQRNADRYQTQVDVSVALLLNVRMTSQGRITPTRLWPEVYEEERRGKKRTARLGDQLLHLDNGNSLPRPALLQDTASQFVQLAQDFAQGRQKLQVGSVVPVVLARPGGVDEWIYDVLALDTLNTGLGEVPAYHLKPRPLANIRGNVTVDMWFAPRLQHLPARIKLTLNEDTWLDLMLDAIEQSAPPS